MKAYGRRSHSPSWPLGVALALAAALAPSPATASTQYPPEIQKYLKLKEPPDCTLCHDQSPGLAGTVHTYVGVSMRGLEPTLGKSNLGALDLALHESDAQQIDSDLDGVSDLDELRNGRNPNIPQGVGDAAPPALPEKAPPLETGCSVRAGQAASNPGVGLIGLGLAYIRLARRLARSRTKALDRTSSRL